MWVCYYDSRVHVFHMRLTQKKPTMIRDMLKAQSRILRDLTKLAKWPKLKETYGF